MNSPKLFKIYRSSAGSGKTFTLTKEYIKLVVKNPHDYKHILAITFTNKATEEMKHRIVGELSSMAKGELSDMRKALQEEFDKANIKTNIQRNAKAALENILHDYSRFEVSTIDSFFTRIVRSFAKELGLPMRYDIDMDNDKALESALDMLYAELQDSTPLKEWVEEFAFHRLEGDKGWNLDFQLLELGRELFKERLQKSFGEIKISIDELKDLVAHLNDKTEKFKTEMQELAREALDLIEARGLSLADFKGGASRSLANYFRNILEGKYTPTPAFLKAMTQEEEWYAKTSSKKELIAEVVHNGLGDLARKIIDYFDVNYREYVSAVELLKNVYSYGLLEAISEKLKIYRDEQNILLMSDTNAVVNNVIEDDDAPFLFEKVGNQYKHILIDEFQDTSQFQWSNLRPLITNALSNEYQVMIVGDVKQSIYRWRGGDMNLLLQQAQQDLDLYKDFTLEESLSDNWRSAKHVVEFNNAFFKAAEDILNETEDLPEGQKLIDMAYKDIVQRPRKENPGYVNVKFFDTETIKDEKTGAKERIDWKEKAKQACCDVVEDARIRGYDYGDMMVLVDKRDYAMQMAEIFEEKEIPFVTESSFLLKESPLVNFLIQVIYYLEDPADSFAKTMVLHQFFQLKQQAEGEKHQIFTDYRQDWEDSIFQQQLPKQFTKRVHAIARKSIFELVEELVYIFELEALADVYLQSFQDECLKLSSKGINDLQSFIEWWKDNENKLAISLPDAGNVIRVMTIHKAKGLEAPIVIIPFADFALRTKANSTFWTDQLSDDYEAYKLLPLNYSKNLMDSSFDGAYRQELLEGLVDRLNVTYVAFTRPREQLYVFAEQFKNLGEVNKLNKLIHSVLSSIYFPFREGWSAEDWNFALGEPPKKKVDQNGLEQLSRPLSQYLSSDYSDRLKVATEYNDRLILFDDEQSQLMKLNMKLKAVLERIQGEDTIDLTLENLAIEGIINQEDIEAIKVKLKTLFDQPVFAGWFDENWQTLTAREIWNKGKTSKPDRVLISGDEAVIVTFKYEYEEERDKRKLRSYAQLLEEMGYPKVYKYVVYVDDLSVREVD
ncbi:MAG: UvrD-helicase domain-containing protein [Bacteroidota bacterium]